MMEKLSMKKFFGGLDVKEDFLGLFIINQSINQFINTRKTITK